MIVGYKLRINGGSLVNVEIDVGLTYSYTFTGLDPATEYSVEIASYDEVPEQSAWSTAVIATTDSLPEMTALIDDEGRVLVDEDGRVITVII